MDGGKGTGPRVPVGCGVRAWSVVHGRVALTAQEGPVQPFCGAEMSASTPHFFMSTHTVPEAMQSSTSSPPTEWTAWGRGEAGEGRRGRSGLAALIVNAGLSHHKRLSAPFFPRTV